MTWATRLLRRDLFGVRLGVLLIVMPLFISSMWFQVATRGVWNHPPDSRYYLTMVSRNMGHPLLDSVMRERALSPDWHVAPWYFASDDPTWQMVSTRMLYPVLSMPFVWFFGLNGGDLAVPILADILFLWAIARTLQRLYGPAVAVVVAGAFSLVQTMFAFSWAGTDALAMGLAAVIVANLPIERSISKANLVWLGAATVFIALTRQVGVLAPAMAGAGWLWCLVRERSWRNRWLSSLIVTAAAMATVQIATMLFVTADQTQALTRNQSTVWGAIRQFIHFLNVVTFEALHYMWQRDHILLALLVAAGVATLIRFKSDAAAVFVGASGATYLITAGVGYSTYMRYEMIMFPAAAIAAGGLVSMALGEFLPATAQEPAEVPESRFRIALPQLSLPAFARRLTAKPRRERWIPQLIGVSTLLATVLGISLFGGSVSSAAAPASPSYAAAQGGHAYAVKPLAKPSAEVTLKAAFAQATEVSMGRLDILEGSFDWTHAVRYRPTAADQPGWPQREADGTTLTRVNGMDLGMARAFSNMLTFNLTIKPKTLKILTRETSAYGEDVSFTVEDGHGVVHRGTATTLYPIWNPKDPGLVTAIVYEP